jgi:serine/threonine-protein kinase RsbW
MHSTAMPTAAAVEVRIPAHPALVPTVQTVVRDLAVRADFDLDAIADLGLAVTEACSTLIGLADTAARLSCRVTIHADKMEIAVITQARVPASIFDTAGLSWGVLRVLTDQTQLESDARGLIAIRFSKRHALWS